MNRLTFWAGRHAAAARLLIILIQICLFGVAYFIAQQLSGLGMEVPGNMLFIPVCLFLAAVAVFPAKPLFTDVLARRRFMIKRRRGHLFIAGSGFLLTVLFFASDNPFSAYNRLEGSTASSVPPATRDSARYMSPVAFARYFYSKEVQQMSPKEKRHILKKQIKAIKRDSGMKSGDKTGLIVLSVLIALGLIYVVAAISCTIACDGSGAAALAVLIIGTGLIIFFLILVIRNLSGRRRRRKAFDAEPSSR